MAPRHFHLRPRARGNRSRSRPAPRHHFLHRRRGGASHAAPEVTSSQRAGSGAAPPCSIVPVTSLPSKCAFTGPGGGGEGGDKGRPPLSPSPDLDPPTHFGAQTHLSSPSPRPPLCVPPPHILGVLTPASPPPRSHSQSHIKSLGGGGGGNLFLSFFLFFLGGRGNCKDFTEIRADEPKKNAIYKYIFYTYIYILHPPLPLSPPLPRTPCPFTL